MPTTQDLTSTSSSSNLAPSTTKWIKQQPSDHKVYLNEQNETVTFELENTEDDKRKFFEALNDRNPEDFDDTSEISSVGEPDAHRHWLKDLPLPQSTTTSSISKSIENRIDDASMSVNDSSVGLPHSIPKNIMAIGHEQSLKSRAVVVKPMIPGVVSEGTETEERPLKPSTMPYIDTSSNASSRILLTSPTRPKKATKRQPEPILDTETEISLSLQLESEADSLSRQLHKSQKDKMSLDQNLSALNAALNGKDQELDEYKERISYFETLIADQKRRISEFENQPDIKELERKYLKQFHEQESLIQGVENEKLLAQVKAHKKYEQEKKKVESTHIENLERENLNLKYKLDLLGTNQGATPKIVDLESKIATLEVEKENLGGEVSRLKQEIGNKLKSSPSLEVDNAVKLVEEKYERILSEYEKKAKENSLIDRSNQEIGELSKLRVENQELNIKLLETEEENVKLRREIDIYSAKEAYLISDFSSKIEELEKSKAKRNSNTSDHAKSENTALKLRISELAKIAEQLSLQNSVLQQEKSKILKNHLEDPSETQSRPHSKIKDLENERETLLQSLRNSDMNAKFEAEARKCQKLQMQIEMLENSRQTYQNTAMELLKQSQKESLNMAFKQSQRSFEILKSEWLKEQQLQLELKMAPSLQKIERLEAELASYSVKDFEISTLKEKIESLKLESENLEAIHRACDSRISNLRATAPPSAQELDSLSTRVIELEEKLRKRNRNSNPNVNEESEVERYKKQMYEQLISKNQEIARFRTEIDGLLSGISILKRNMM